MNRFMMKAFRSPENETSIWKNIPIEAIDEVQSYIRENYGESARKRGLRFLYRYRGKRRPGISGQMICLKNEANRFSVYLVGGNSRFDESTVGMLHRTNSEAHIPA